MYGLRPAGPAGVSGVRAALFPNCRKGFGDACPYPGEVPPGKTGQPVCVRFGGHGPGGGLGHPLCPGGVRHPGCCEEVHTRRRCGHRAGRRGRQDPVPHRLYGSADERLLRRRHRGLYRPDGHPAVYHPHRIKRHCRAKPAVLQHRLPVRRVCQERYPGPFEPGRPKG